MSPPLMILFTGGGTGGHLFPGIAVAQELKRRRPDVRPVFIGTPRLLESQIFSQQSFEHRILSVEPLSALRKRPFAFLTRNWRSLSDARQVIEELKPRVIVGLGGYASAPMIWSGYRRDVPIVLLEQNAIPGRANRWLGRFANRVCITFGESQNRFPYPDRVVLTGNPVRREIIEISNRSPAQLSGRRQLLILGGSQGADSLNDAVLVAIEKNVQRFRDWRIQHQTGDRQIEQVREAYRKLSLDADVEPFFHNMAERYASATLVVSRAGATTLSELACAGLPMILLPYPYATDQHQAANARCFVEGNCAAIVQHEPDPAQTALKLATELQRMIENDELLQARGRNAKRLARPDADQAIVNVIEQLL